MSEVAACTGIQPVSTRRQRVRLGRSVAGRERWRTTADSNREPPTSSALPVELSQRIGKIDKKGSRRRPRDGSDRVAAPGPAPRPESGCSQCQRARRRRRRNHRRWASWSEWSGRARGCACAVGTRDELGGWTSVGSLGHLPSCLCGGGRALRRLFRYRYRALLGPPGRAVDARATDRDHEQPITRTIEASGGGAGRGGDM